MSENEFGNENQEEQTDEISDTTIEERDNSEEILSIIRSDKSKREIAEELSNYHDNDIASVLELLTAEERKKLYSSLSTEAMSDIFAYLDDAGPYIEEMDAGKAADIIEEMDADDAIDVLDELDEDKRRELLELMEPEAKEDIELIHSYDDDEFGSLMTTNFIVIEKGLTIKQAMKSLIEQAAENDNISTIYVVDEEKRFYGAIELKDLIIARQEVSLESLIVTSYPFVFDNESISESIEKLKDYSEDSIPVLSNEDRSILGVITAQDIVEAIDDEMGEDYAKLAGLTAEEDLNEPLSMSIKKRFPWLVVLLLLGLGISTIIGLFDGVQKSLVILVCFQSLILEMAGNTGTQSLAVTIRVITDDTLTFKQRIGLIFKEMRVGLSNGLMLGSCAFLFIGLYIHFFKGEVLSFAFSASACVGIALCIAMLVASFTGTTIPLIFKRIGVDPAVASGPLITTINDLVAVCIYYGMAWILLINILGFGNH